MKPAATTGARVSITPVSLRALRWRARLLRGLIQAAALAGLAASARYAVAPPRAIAPRPVAAHRDDRAAAGFAELFARRYLTWDGDRPEAFDAALAQSIGANADAGAGLRPPPGGHQRVFWSAVVQERPGAIGERVYTVAAQTDTGGLVYLSVAVARVGSGRLALSRYPAFVGAPSTAPARLDAVGSPVTDPELATVARRALTNYLEGSVSNLAADLAPGAHVAAPQPALTPLRTLELRWAPGGAAVLETVAVRDPRGVQQTLAYELDVQRRDGRWQVAAVQMDPRS